MLQFKQIWLYDVSYYIIVTVTLTGRCIEIVEACLHILTVSCSSHKNDVNKVVMRRLPLKALWRHGLSLHALWRHDDLTCWPRKTSGARNRRTVVARRRPLKPQKKDVVSQCWPLKSYSSWLQERAPTRRHVRRPYSWQPGLSIYLSQRSISLSLCTRFTLCGTSGTRLINLRISSRWRMETRGDERWEVRHRRRQNTPLVWRPGGTARRRPF